MIDEDDAVSGLCGGRGPWNHVVAGTSSPHIAPGDAKGKQGVDLPKVDPLLQAIQKRF